MWTPLRIVLIANAADNLRSVEEPRRHGWLAVFFAFGATMCALTVGLLLFPGSPFDALWRLNPDARPALQSLGNWSFVLMLAVGTGCFVASIGLWRGAVWGTRVAVIILSVNILADVINAVLRHDYRALIGLPIGVVMIFFLLRADASLKSFRTRRKGG
jgi:hypothetical protein